MVTGKVDPLALSEAISVLERAQLGLAPSSVERRTFRAASLALRQLGEPAAIAVSLYAHREGLSLEVAEKRLRWVGGSFLSVAGIAIDAEPWPEDAPAHRGERLQDFVA